LKHEFPLLTDAGFSGTAFQALSFWYLLGWRHHSAWIIGGALVFFTFY